MDDADNPNVTTAWLEESEISLPSFSKRHLPHRKPATSRRTGIPAGESQRIPWSWHIGRFAGIDVYIHATFLILIAWLLWAYLRAGSTLLEAATGIGFVMAVFFCVVLHEYGHALMARQFGIATRDITLLPIGGMARLERIPKVPWQELVVALAGPLVNVVIALMLFAGLALSGSAFDTGYNPVTGMGTHPLVELMGVNVMLVLFNMLPAFPMDGGRVLRALLAMKLPRIKATRVASVCGQAIAILFGLVGLMGQPFLLFIALFVFIGASQEYQMIRWETAVEGVQVHDVMMTSFRTVVQNDPLSRAVTLSLQGSQHDFPVLDDRFRVCGLLLRTDLIAALHHQPGSDAPLSTAMREVTVSATPDEPLVGAYERMQTAGLPVLPVFAPDGNLIGLLTTENVAEIVMVRDALEEAQRERKSA
jgi:Zn-dependent protease